MIKENLAPAVPSYIIKKEKRRFAQDAGGKLYLYKDGSYQPGAEEFVRERTKSFFRAQRMTALWSSTIANEAIEYIRVDSPLLWGRPPQDQARLSNGILDLRKWRLVPHTKLPDPH